MVQPMLWQPTSDDAPNAWSSCICMRPTRTRYQSTDWLMAWFPQRMSPEMQIWWMTRRRLRQLRPRLLGREHVALAAGIVAVGAQHQDDVASRIPLRLDRGDLVGSEVLRGQNGMLQRALIG